MDLTLLSRLVHHRWSLPALAELHRHGGARFVVMLHAIGLSRDSLSRTLAGLIEEGVVMKNPGYGIALRPEYILTPLGERIAPAAAEVVEELKELQAEEPCLRKWSLPALLAVARGRCRFNEIREAMPEATPRAIAAALKTLQKARLIDRRIEDSYPPTPIYEPALRVQRLADLLETLVRAGERETP